MLKLLSKRFSWKGGAKFQGLEELVNLLSLDSQSIFSNMTTRNAILCHFRNHDLQGVRILAVLKHSPGGGGGGDFHINLYLCAVFQGIILQPKFLNRV